MMEIPVHPAIDLEISSPRCKNCKIKSFVSGGEIESIIIFGNAAAKICSVICFIYHTIWFSLWAADIPVFNIPRLQGGSKLRCMSSNFRLRLKYAFIYESIMLPDNTTNLCFRTDTINRFVVTTQGYHFIFQRRKIR